MKEGLHTQCCMKARPVRSASTNDRTRQGKRKCEYVAGVGADARSVDVTFPLLERCFDVAVAAGSRDLLLCS